MSLVPPLRLPARRIETVTDATRSQLSDLVAEDPVINAVIEARLASYRTVDPAVFGGRLFAARDDGGRITGAAFDGGHLIPLGGTPADWAALAAHVGDDPRRCTSIAGRADAVAAMWTVLEPRWSPARAIRSDQPLLVLHRGDPIPVRPDPRVRVLGREHMATYLPAAVEMFTEELGVSPFDGPFGGGYRHARSGSSTTGSWRSRPISVCSPRPRFRCRVSGPVRICADAGWAPRRWHTSSITRSVSHRP